MTNNCVESSATSHWKTGEAVEDFALRLNTVASQLRVLDDDISDKELIKKMLHVVPSSLSRWWYPWRYCSTLIPCQSRKPSAICAVEQWKKPALVKESGDHLLQNEEEWIARMKSRDSFDSNTSAHNGGGDKGGDKNKGDKVGVGGKWKSVADHDDTCDYYGKKDHWARECSKKKHDEEAQGHVTLGEEDEWSHLLAHDVIINLPSTSYPTSTTAQCHHIHIDEQKVFTDLGSTERNHHDWWVLDTGATNHMNKSREIFVELNSQIIDTVKFGDGSITKIEGRGSIVLTCKSGAHHTLTGVYYIPRLKASVISIGQLDESDWNIAINGGILCVYDQSEHLLAKVVWDDSRLYHLTLNVGRLVCLAACTSEAALLCMLI
jgi:hypothetical protein